MRPLPHRGVQNASESSPRQTSFLGEFLERPRTFGCFAHTRESPRHVRRTHSRKPVVCYRRNGTRSMLLDSGHFVWEDRAEDYAAAILDWIRGGYRAA
jgi:hypothetical protein